MSRLSTQISTIMKSSLIALLLIITHATCATLNDFQKSTLNSVNGEFRIIGGKPAKVGEFRGQVSLQNRYHSHICAGILIDPLHVITAGHCFQPEKAIGYVMGDDIWVSPNGSHTRQVRRVKHFVQHPNFSGDTMRNDIGVIRVDKPFESNERFGPMCRTEFTPPVGAHCTVCGWGYTLDEDHGGGAISYKQLRTNVQVVETEFCNSSISYDGAMQPGMFCAGRTRGGGHDSCQGDSGGLLTCGGMGMISGVVSFGYECGQPAFPGIYTDISMYNVWVDNIVSRKILPDYEYSPFFKPGSTNDTDSSTEKGHSTTLQLYSLKIMIFITFSIIFISRQSD